MKTLIRTLAAAAILAMPLAATDALAHAHLLKSMPAEGAVTASPQMIMLTFSEKLTDKMSGFEVVKADGTKVDVQVAIADGGKVLHAMPSKPLAPGAYKVNWVAVTDDGHRMTGTVTFTVK
ncbi:copper homeostasis periplasmic binding protein CopC [Asticcacaulis sp.]|uniref:copper homeostasis periplasmic binding protein CopC n=1 Tax=Asticcacaulis sp. TaxID=1872648 RepID=UPI003F7B5144